MREDSDVINLGTFSVLHWFDAYVGATWVLKLLDLVTLVLHHFRVSVRELRNCERTECTIRLGFRV